MYLLDFNLSVAVWVGMIAMAGLAAEMGVLMMLYLDLSCRQRSAYGGQHHFDVNRGVNCVSGDLYLLEGLEIQIR